MSPLLYHPPRRDPPARRFDVNAARELVQATLSRPPARPHIVRVSGAGHAVARFYLPLDLCPALNAFAEWPAWRRQRCKGNALAVMLGQAGRWDAPLRGRPRVLAVRFSSVEPDRDSGWSKVPIDRLTGKRGGLGLIRDDRPSAIDLHQWHEPAPPKCGCVMVEVWTG